MCGFAGRYHSGSLEPNPGWRARVDELLAHRGPDGRGCYYDLRCELVHRRLALVDLSANGAQPMANEDGAIQVVFNGEIYNHRELRSELQARGHLFRGSSDTEVLVHLYEDQAEQMAPRLRGMFAFALLDRRRNRLMLARDRFGIKPLYYARHREEWVFASEMKAILALDGFEPELDRQACYDFLGLSYIPEPATGFANILALPKGTTLLIDERGARTIRFASVRLADNEGISRADVSAHTAALLSRAVARQAAADVPVAALLSGGIDSSLVVAAYAKNTGRPIETFNVSFPDRAHDETPLALATARRYGTRHHTIELEHKDITPESVFGLLRHFDQPFADPSLVPTHAVSRAVRQRGIICTLTGDGGDEAFGGYSELARAERLFQLTSAPEWLLETAGSLARPMAGWTRDAGRLALKAVQLARAGRSNPAALLAGLSNYLTEQEKEDLVLPSARLGLQGVHRLFGNSYARATDIEQVSRQMTLNYFDISLPSNMLRKVDMMSMRAGIEVRVPMLDEDLVSLALALPHDMRTDGRQGKLVLRDVASSWLPADVACHPKHGFTIPLDVMVQPRFHEGLQDLIGAADSCTASFLDRRLVQRWLKQFRLAAERRGGGSISREGLYLRVLMLLALELWLRDQRLVW